MQCGSSALCPGRHQGCGCQRATTTSAVVIHRGALLGLDTKYLSDHAAPCFRSLARTERCLKATMPRQVAHEWTITTRNVRRCVGGIASVTWRDFRGGRGPASWSYSWSSKWWRCVSAQRSAMSDFDGIAAPSCLCCYTPFLRLPSPGLRNEFDSNGTL